jgi:hypothetical protein
LKAAAPEVGRTIMGAMLMAMAPPMGAAGGIFW